jgi:hypothetical protein
MDGVSPCGFVLRIGKTANESGEIIDTGADHHRTKPSMRRRCEHGAGALTVTHPVVQAITLRCLHHLAPRSVQEAKDMLSSEKDRLATEVEDRWVNFQEGLSDKRTPESLLN